MRAAGRGRGGWSVAAGMVLAACAASARAEESLSAAEWVARGNAALAEEKYDEALEAYGRAEVALPRSAEVSYNRGIVHYRRGDFEQARAAFGDALRTRDPMLEAKAKYNLGNCAYSTALQKLSDLPGAIDELRKALTYYRDALVLNPDDLEARQNIEIAQLLMKDLIDREKRRQEEQQKQQEQNPQTQPTTQPQGEPQEGDRQERQQQQRQQQQQQDDARQQQEQQQQSQDGQQQNEQQKEQKQRQAGHAEPRQLNREEAERMLQAIRDKERARRDERRRLEMIGGRMPVERDW